MPALTLHNCLTNFNRYIQTNRRAPINEFDRLIILLLQKTQTHTHRRYNRSTHDSSTHKIIRRIAAWNASQSCFSIYCWFSQKNTLRDCPHTYKYTHHISEAGVVPAYISCQAWPHFHNMSIYGVVIREPLLYGIQVQRVRQSVDNDIVYMLTHCQPSTRHIWEAFV